MLPEVGAGEGAMDQGDAVRAAGGVVWRRGGHGLEVVLVHRPAYDDWSFPKGKLLDGESDEEAALREVLEETGLTCRLGAPLGDRSYRDRKGRPKVVRYWAMEAGSGVFEPTDEIDRVAWLTLDRASWRLTYEHDRMLLDALVSSIEQGS